MIKYRVFIKLMKRFTEVKSV